MLADRRTRTTIDRDTFTITFQRSLAASPEQVFEAWTRPEHLRVWWDPTGAPLSDCQVDLRPGGRFCFTNRDSAHAPPFAGAYLEVEPPSRLVFEAMGAVGTVRLEPRADGSDLTVTIRCGSLQHLEQFVALGVDTGTGQTLDNLVRYLG